MISFKTFYTEAKQVGILYHYTSIFRLPRILSMNQLGEWNTYVSFTRDKNFHRHTREGIEVEECRFVIDGDKLSQHYRVLPYNYFGDKGPAGIGKYAEDRPHHRTWDEQEERVMKNVTDLKNYIIKLQIFKDSIDRFFASGLDRRFDIDVRSGNFVHFNSADQFITYLRQFCKVEVI
jgi:hypothetical protein